MKTPMEETVYLAVLNGDLEIDSEGRIWRIRKRGWDRWKQMVVSRPCKRMRAEHDIGEYLQISVMFDKKLYGTGAHRLVYRHFKGPIPEGLTINHDNGRKKDNYPDNLLLATYSEQLEHAYRIGLMEEWGEKNPAAKIRNEAVLAIREEYAKGQVTQVELAKKHGIAFQTVSKIVRGERRPMQSGPTADYVKRRNNLLRERNEMGQFL
jgi:DNA-binding XRE family transcriptional regulator